MNNETKNQPVLHQVIQHLNQNKKAYAINFLFGTIRCITQFVILFIAVYGLAWLYFFSPQNLDSSIEQLSYLSSLERRELIDNLYQIVFLLVAISYGLLVIIKRALK